MAPLAAPALQAVRTGAIRILPERWLAVYVNWLENIRDWNISRQLWWGHRIPVWYCDACEAPRNVIVSRDDVPACPTCGGTVRQDEDVLDTWFSSWLWPLSTLGWPNEEAEDFKAFYPTDVQVARQRRRSTRRRAALRRRRVALDARFGNGPRHGHHPRPERAR